MKTPPAILLATLVSGMFSPLKAVDPATAEGHWRAGFLSVTHTLGIQKTANGQVTSLLYAQHFDNGLGYLNVGAGGAFTGVFDGPVSGAVSLNTSGEGSFSTGNVYHFNENGDFAMGIETSEPGWRDLQCMVRTPEVTPPLSVLQGRWNMVSIDAPFELTTISQMGVVTDVGPLDKFGVFTGQLDFDAAGGFSGNFDGPLSGTASIGAQGAVTSPAFAPGEVFSLNASNDVMFTFHDEGSTGGYRYFIGMVKAPASLMTHELKGRWRIVSIDTPDELIVEKNAENEVIGIQGENHFGAFQGVLDIDENGVVSGHFDGPVSAQASAGPNGEVTISEVEVSTTFHMNASKNVMMAVQTEAGSPGFCELLMMVRGVVPRTISIHDAPAALSFCWPDDGKVKLQRSIDLISWRDVVTPNACHTEPLSSGRAFFQLVPAP